MKRDVLRIGTDTFVNVSELQTSAGFDALFNQNYEFVYVPEFYPWNRVNGTWQGALGHIQNDNHLWIECGY